MKQDGKYAGEDQGSYVLPVCNTDEEKRNFVGYKGSEQYFSLEDMRQGDSSGTTDSDYATHKGDSYMGGYTKINQTPGKPLKGKAGTKPTPMKAGRY